MIHVFLGGRGLLPVEGPLKKGKKAHRPAPRFVQLQFLQLRHHRTKEDGEAHQNFASNGTWWKAHETTNTCLE